MDPVARAFTPDKFRLSTAVLCGRGAYTYDDLLRLSARVASELLNPPDAAPEARSSDVGPRGDLGEAPVAFLTAPDIAYVAAQWGIWRAGGIAVPLCVKHPARELEYVLDDTGARQALVDAEFRERLEPLARARGIRLIDLEPLLRGVGVPTPGEVPTPDEVPTLPDVAPERRAMILYTSGTTSRPKGVVTTHANIQAQTDCLLAAWEWSSDDHIINVLPLHHAHGILNVLICALRSGATLEMHEKFDARHIWERFAAGVPTLFMAVPTIYVKLISAWEEASPEDRARYSAGARGLRLMVSGSAALPVSVLERWREISGQVLLERYGMTEIGMGLSNSYRGARVPGAVGTPLPGVEVRLIDEESGEVITEEARPGEIQVRGPNVFKEYWQKPEATEASFVEGWFKTGDVALRENGVYRILGRNSVDIIKSGGYKLSALEIEEALREHPRIDECAVVGMPDAEWGELVCALIVPAVPNVTADYFQTSEFRAWAESRLGSYKLPRRYLVVDALPRNVLGKVTKPAVRDLFEPGSLLKAPARQKSLDPRSSDR